MTGELDGRFAFNTAIAAVMELTNECYRLRGEVGAGALRFAAATAASLIFPVRAARRQPTPTTC